MMGCMAIEASRHVYCKMVLFSTSGWMRSRESDVVSMRRSIERQQTNTFIASGFDDQREALLIRAQEGGKVAHNPEGLKLCRIRDLERSKQRRESTSTESSRVPSHTHTHTHTHTHNR
jgi:hypothetical protein